MIAQDGEPGLGKGMDGAAGKDLIVKVPCGTLVWGLEPDEPAGRRNRRRRRKPATLLTGSSRRPIIRHAGAEQADGN